MIQVTEEKSRIRIRIRKPVVRIRGSGSVSKNVMDPEHWGVEYKCPTRIRLYFIPDPNCLHPGSSSKNLSILTPKKTKKWFLNSTKYDPGWSSRISDPDADFLPIPDPGSRGQKGTQSRIRIRNNVFNPTLSWI